MAAFGGGIVGHNTGSRQTLIAFGRGLFALRYAGSDNQSVPPRVRYALPIGFQGVVRVLPAPGLSLGELLAVGDIAILSADAPGAVDVFVEERKPGAGVACSIALDRIGGAASERVGDVRPVAVAPASPPPAELVAHLSYRGDVAVMPGEWIGGPQAPAPIEGLAIPAAFSGGVELEYQILPVGGADWSGWASAGSFAGSRGQGRPLRGVRLRVLGSPGAAIRADALFLGATINQKIGQHVEFVSSSPYDAMVGLRIELVRDAAVKAPQAQLPTSPSSTGKLKVFRSSLD